MSEHNFAGRRRVRKQFGSIQEVAAMPNLIEVQKHSYDQFLIVKDPEGGRPDEGLQAVFKSVFPITDFSERAQLEFVRYEFEDPKYDVEECQQRGMTYAAPLKVTLRLIVFDRVPWPRPDILHKARRERFGGRRYDDLITRLRLKQAFGRLVRQAGDQGVFVMLDSRTPSRLATAFPDDVAIERIGLAEAVAKTGEFLLT